GCGIVHCRFVINVLTQVSDLSVSRQALTDLGGYAKVNCMTVQPVLRNKPFQIIVPIREISLYLFCTSTYAHRIIQTKGVFEEISHIVGLGGQSTLFTSPVGYRLSGNYRPPASRSGRSVNASVALSISILKFGKDHRSFKDNA